MADAPTVETASAPDDAPPSPASPYKFILRHWRAILKRTFQSIADDHITPTAAGMAFYALLAIFPALAAVISIWGLVASVFVSVYVQNFARYSEVYGSIGAVVVLLMWFWASAFVFLIGAEIASEVEKEPRLRARRDTAEKTA